MKLSPGLYTLDGSGAAEVIAIAVFTQPSALARKLADVLATRFRAVSLAMDSARVGKKKPAAMAALTPRAIPAHNEPSLRRINSARKWKSRPPRKRNPKKEEGLSV